MLGIVSSTRHVAHVGDVGPTFTGVVDNYRL